MPNWMRRLLGKPPKPEGLWVQLRDGTRLELDPVYMGRLENGHHEWTANIPVPYDEMRAVGADKIPGETVLSWKFPGIEKWSP